MAMKDVGMAKQLLTMTMTNSAGGFTNFDANATPDDGEVHIIILPKFFTSLSIIYLKLS